MAKPFVTCVWATLSYEREDKAPVRPHCQPIRQDSVRRYEVEARQLRAQVCAS